MSAIVNFSINLKDLPKEKIIQGKKGTYINLSMSIHDQPNQFGQNTGIYIHQSKEERENKTQKMYIGNGQVVWNDGSITNAPKPVMEKEKVEVSEHLSGREDDLPF